MTRRDTLKSLLLAGSIKAGLGQIGNSAPVAGEYSVPVVGHDAAVAYRFRAFAGVVAVDIGGGETLHMACIPGGTGQVGTEDPWQPFPVREPDRTPVRSISVRPFCLSLYEVTQAQWIRVSQMPRVNRDLRVLFISPRNRDEARYPAVEGITYEQVEEFCARVTRYTGIEFRAPSEAEWEYACRAGTTTRFHFGDTENRDFTVWSRLTPVGIHNEPNRYGLHDMHGGADEWCADWVHSDYRGAPGDQSAWTGSGDSSLRITRGGIRAGSATRSFFHWQGYYSGLGFRPAATLDHGIMDPVARTLLHAASGESPDSVAPGQLVSIFGDWIGPQSASAGIIEAQPRRFREELQGVEVWFDDRKAPVLYASRTQINAVAPLGLTPQSVTRVVVRNGFQSAHPRNVAVAAAQPGLFTVDSTGTGQAAAGLEDGSPNNSSRPARAGSVLSLYGSGFGVFDRLVADGEIVTAGNAPRVTAPVRVEIGGVPATVEYAGQAPETVAGVVQVNVRISPGTPSGSQPIAVFAGESRSRSGPTVFIA